MAAAHVIAAFSPDAVGHRHIITSSREFVPMKQWADILIEEFEAKGYQIPREVEENTKPLTRSILDDSRMINVLGLTPHDIKSTIIDMANSVISLNIQ